MEPLKQYAVKLTNGRAFHWKTVYATSESMARSQSLKPWSARYGWGVSECNEVKQKESA